MQLYIMRHGEAEEFTNSTFKSDNERQLTKQGQFEAKLMANWLLKLNLNLKHIFVSPFIRAQQTCEHVLKTMKLEAITLDFITPSGDARQVHDFIDGLLIDEVNMKKGADQETSLLIVSHMPLVSYLVSELTADAQAPIFTTAGIAQINYDTATMKGEFVRMVSPLDFC